MSLPLATQPTLLMNYPLINLHVMSHAVKLLKLPCFSAVSFYTQLPIVLHQNDPNVQFIPITVPFAIIRIFVPHFIFKIHHQMRIIRA